MEAPGNKKSRHNRLIASIGNGFQCALGMCGETGSAIFGKPHCDPNADFIERIYWEIFSYQLPSVVNHQTKQCWQIAFFFYRLSDWYLRMIVRGVLIVIEKLGFNVVGNVEMV